MKKGLMALCLLSSMLITSCTNADPSSEVPNKEEQVVSSSENSSLSSNSGEQSSSSSGSSSLEPEEDGYLKKDVVVQLEPGIKTPKENEELEPYDLTFSYDDELFLTDAEEYNQDLSMLSLGASFATATKAKGDAFFNALRFKDVVAHDYDKVSTINTMGYYMAHRSIDEYELVTVAFRGFNYGMEWANNLLIGKEGNHQGFDARALEAYDALQDYVEEHVPNDKSLKLWINGYSRAGALSDLLAHHILEDEALDVNQSDMYVYTFEAPASIENPNQYRNVHDIVNENDIVANIIPEEYGLFRCGEAYEMYDEDVCSIALEFDEDMLIPEFNLKENARPCFENDS